MKRQLTDSIMQPGRDRDMTRQERIEYAIDLRLHGLSYREIGHIFGISRQGAYYLVQPSDEVRAVILERCNGQCEDCGIALESGHYHHAATLVTDTAAYNDTNLIKYLCLRCHMHKHKCNHKRMANPPEL